jgi:uncharacterized protein
MPLRLLKLTAWLLTVLVGVYAALLLYMYVRQEAFLFQPAPLAANHQYAVGGLEEIAIPVDGAVIAARHLKLPNPTGVIFFLHGNGGNNDSWVANADLYKRVNFDFFIIDYRGYGKSTGRISSEAELHQDVRRAWDFVAPQYANKIKVIFGRSLGTGLAAKLAADVQPHKTILVSAYRSMGAMVQQVYPFIPRALLRYPLATEEYVPRIQTPVLLFHGDRDELIPVAHSLHLKSLAPHGEAIVIPNGHHADLQEIPFYYDTLAEKLLALGPKV